MSETKKKKHPPNPLPCGCAVVGYPEIEAYGSDYQLRMEYKDQHVKHCQLHAAAPDLLAAATAVVERWDTPNWKDTAPTAEVIGLLRAAIAKATK